MIVHNIEVNDIGASFQNIVDFLAQLREVSRKNGGSNQIVLVTPDIQRGSESGSFGLVMRTKIFDVS